MAFPKLYYVYLDLYFYVYMYTSKLPQGFRHGSVKRCFILMDIGCLRVLTCCMYICIYVCMCVCVCMFCFVCVCLSCVYMYILYCVFYVYVLYKLCNKQYVMYTFCTNIVMNSMLYVRIVQIL